MQSEPQNSSKETEASGAPSQDEANPLDKQHSGEKSGNTKFFAHVNVGAKKGVSVPGASAYVEGNAEVDIIKPEKPSCTIL